MQLKKTLSHLKNAVNGFFLEKNDMHLSNELTLRKSFNEYEEKLQEHRVRHGKSATMKLLYSQNKIFIT